MNMGKVLNKKWYGVSTRSLVSLFKNLYACLTQKNVKCFLPMQKITQMISA